MLSLLSMGRDKIQKEQKELLVLTVYHGISDEQVIKRTVHTFKEVRTHGN